MKTVLLALVLVADPASGDTPTLAPLPELPLERLEETVRDAFVEATADVASARDATPAAQAALWGRLGGLYYFADLSVPAAACWGNAALLEPDNFAWPYYLGVVDRLEGRLEDARAELSRALELRPDDVPARLRLGRVLLDLGRIVEAREQFQRLEDGDPDLAAALQGLGEVALRQQRYDDAVGLLERALALQPSATSLHHQLGLAYRGLGDLEAARRHLGMNRHDRVAFPDPLMEALEDAAAGGSHHYRMGVDALREGRLEVAIREFQRAAELRPEDSGAFYNLGVALASVGRTREAIDAYRSAVKRDPGHRDAQYNLAVLLFQAGDLTGAEEHLAATHRIDPLDRQAQLEWSVVLGRLGRREEARSQLEDLVRSEPSFVEARDALAVVLLQLGSEEEAAEVLERGLEEDHSPEQGAQLLERLGAVEEGRGEADAAAEQYRRAIELDPARLSARERWANLLGRRGRFEEAAGQFDRLVEERPEEPRYRLGQAMSRLLGQQYLEARRVLEAARAELPHAVEATDLLARLLATCPLATVRDGSRAVELARESFGREQTVEHAETLAMALAEEGRFSEAVDWQRRIVAERERRSELQLVARSRRYLELYEARSPVRAPWLEAS